VGTDTQRIARQTSDRAEELQRFPPQTIDRSKWPKAVRPIEMTEANGLGIDRDGRLYWNGKPVEIIGQRLDLSIAPAKAALRSSWAALRI